MPDENEGWGWGEIMRGQLVDKVGGEIGELMLELELNAGGQERGALEKSEIIGSAASPTSPPSRSAMPG